MNTEQLLLKCSAVAVLFLSSINASAQQSKPVLQPLPSDMDCKKVTGDKVALPANSDSLIKRGNDYYLCRLKNEARLARARTAAVTIRSTQTISCGDGSTNDCLREDKATERTIEGFLDETDLWRYFQKAPPAKADLILQFIANNRADSSSPIILQVQDSDSGEWVYYESRNATDLENDVNRLIEHFLGKVQRAPLISRTDMEKARQCALIAEQLSSLQAQYEVKRDEVTFKNNHQLDAQMDECNLHWKEFVCLQRGAGMYAEQWAESGQEMQRKLALGFEELHDMEQRMAAIRQQLCK